MDDLPPPIKISPNSPNPPDDKSKDDPLFEAKINNPFSKFFNWIKDFIKKQSNITIKIPIVGVLIAVFSLGAGLGGYKIGFNNALAKFFPDSSPVFHRAISVDGLIQKSASGKYYLKSGDNYNWILKSVSKVFNLADYVSKQVTVKGNLTKEKSVIEVAEIIPFNSPASQDLVLEPVIPQTSLNSPNTSELPDLYPNLQWETNRRKLLIFTSGKRKIEQEGVYLESAQVSAFPQEFINYYLEALKTEDFKETLNSINPEGITITYAKDELFLTFGIKNIYKGSGSSRQLSGYKAFIEHN